MSIPPQLIRVKRKRDDETPVTFLQFDKEAKRHRSERNWVYQRRHAAPPAPANVPDKTSRDAEPVIHVSSPHAEPPSERRTTSNDDASADKGNKQQSEPRRFHISKKMMMSGNQSPGAGVSKKVRYGPAVFVERSARTRHAQKASQGGSTLPPQDKGSSKTSPLPAPVDAAAQETQPAEERRLKKPGITSRGRSPRPDPNGHAPLPASAMNPHKEDMSKITDEMNDWVMKEIGANLHNMERERQAERHRFKPKAPAQRYQERHPETAPAALPNDSHLDMDMNDASDIDDEDDWIIEEYVRVPAYAMLPDVAPTDVGLLVLEGEEDSNLFYGPEHDDEDDLDEDEEDENAENYYTADYPEDEVESDDEYGRHPYGYRNGNASDDEEFDNDMYDDTDDEMIVEGDGEDASMARLKAFVKRSRGNQ